MLLLLLLLLLRINIHIYNIRRLCKAVLRLGRKKLEVDVCLDRGVVGSYIELGTGKKVQGGGGVGRSRRGVGHHVFSPSDGVGHAILSLG